MSKPHPCTRHGATWEHVARMAERRHINDYIARVCDGTRTREDVYKALDARFGIGPFRARLAYRAAINSGLIAE